MKASNKAKWLGLLLGVVLSVPATYGLLKWRSINRGIEANHWRVSFSTGDFGHNYLLRAAIAVFSIGNAVPEEALYFHGFKDSQDRTLNGANRYVITFPKGQLPPVDAFWSLTVYRASDSFLVANPIARYSLNAQSPGVQTNADGSLSFYLQHDAPPAGTVQASNWLPTPSDDFTVTLRTYLPQKVLLNLSYLPPAMIKQEGK